MAERRGANRLFYAGMNGEKSHYDYGTSSNLHARLGVGSTVAGRGYILYGHAHME